MQSGNKPGPGQYLSQDYGRPNTTPSGASSSFGFATRDAINTKQVDPLMKPTPKGDLAPGPGAYPLEGDDRITALDRSLKSALAASPATQKSGASHFTFASAPSVAIKYSNSRVKSPAAVKISTSEARFETGPFGRFELNRLGVQNPPPGSYEAGSTFRIGGTVDSPVRSSFVVATSPHATFGGTAPRSTPLGRNELYEASWMPVPSTSHADNLGPGCYDGAAPSGLGKQPISTKSSAAAMSIPTEKRDARYNYYQPGFTKPDKPFTIPPPGAYNVRDVPIGPAVKASKFGTSGRSPVGLVYT